MYIYLVDGGIVQDSKEPTEADIRAVSEGKLTVLKVEEGNVQYLSDMGPWFDVNHAHMRTDNRHHVSGEAAQSLQ